MKKIIIVLLTIFLILIILEIYMPSYYKLELKENSDKIEKQLSNNIPAQRINYDFLIFETKNEVAKKGIPIIEKEPLQEEGPACKWAEDDLEMLACIIYCEAGSDTISDDTRLKVGCVVMNRVDHELYPNTVYDVLVQKNQYGRFYWTGIVWPERSTREEEQNAVLRAYDIAERVLDGERLLDSEYVFQAEFKQTENYIYQDGIYFCSINKKK